MTRWLSSMCACLAALSPAQEPAPPAGADALAPFARLTGGEWRVTFQSGTSQLDTWTWGPGRRSVLNRTRGSDAAGDPWRALDVYYWHPGGEEVRLLGLLPDVPGLGRGVAEGRIDLDGETAEAAFDLHQPGHPGGPRAMGLRWRFDGPDRYRETLLEEAGSTGLVPLGEWAYVRSGRPAAPRPGTDGEEPEVADHLEPLVPLLGRTWEDADGVRSTFERIPYVEAVHARVVAPGEDGEALPLMDAFLYHHPTADALRCLALSAEGRVHEGEVSVLEGGALRLDLLGHEDGGQAVARVVRLDLEDAGTLRVRAWPEGRTERPPLLDTRHRRLAWEAVARPVVDRGTAFVGVDVVPMDSERVLVDQTVLVKGGVVRALGPSAEVEVPAGCEVIDGSGKYLVPGLSDMHAHVWGEDYLILFLARGVTTVRNMFGDPLHLALRGRVAAGELLGPTIYTGGPIVDGNPPAASGGVVVSTALEAADAVRSQAGAGYDFIKVYSLLSPESYDAILETARELGIPVAGHVPVRVGLQRALASGQVTIEHLTTYQLALLRDDSPYRVPGSMRGLRDALLSWEHVDTTRFPAVVEATAASGTWNCPTLVVNAAKTPDEEHEAQLARPEMRYVPEEVVAGWTREVPGVRALSSDDRRRARATVRVKQELVEALHDGGCGILLGTDCMTPFVVPGFSVHEELRLLVEAGLSPFEALAAGTCNAARALDRIDEFGTIAVGRRADLLLLGGNPLEDVAHAGALAGVMARGRWLSIEDLERRLEEVARR